MKPRPERFSVPFRYAFVGSLGTAIDLGSLYIFVDILHIHLLVSKAMSFILEVINNFALNTYWTVQDKSSLVRQPIIKSLIEWMTWLLMTEILWPFSSMAWGFDTW
ncbi:MAG: GtrA family protein [Dissulfurispiraceae bacterium]